jgi:hypothetical protein
MEHPEAMHPGALVLNIRIRSRAGQ